MGLAVTGAGRIRPRMSPGPAQILLSCNGESSHPIHGRKVSVVALDGRRLIDPACYAEHGYPWEEWARLRREAPVSQIEVSGWPAYSKHRRAGLRSNLEDRARRGARGSRCCDRKEDGALRRLDHH